MRRERTEEGRKVWRGKRGVGKKERRCRMEKIGYEWNTDGREGWKGDEMDRDG